MNGQQMLQSYNASVFQQNVEFVIFAVLILVAVVIAGAVLKRQNFRSSLVDHELEQVRQRSQSERIRHERDLAQVTKEHAAELAALRATIEAQHGGRGSDGFGYGDYAIDPLLTSVGHPSNPKNRQVQRTRKIGFDVPNQGKNRRPDRNHH